jgi:F0F1-type ATP synthase assembly protein I
MLPFSRRGITQVLIKLEINEPQKTNKYSLGILFGLNRYLAITAIIIPRITFVTEDITEAETCRMLVTSTLFEMELQKVLISASVYMLAIFALQKQNLFASVFMEFI